METTGNTGSKKCKDYSEISQKKLNVHWEIELSKNKILVAKLIPSSEYPKIKWKLYNESGDLIYEDLIRHMNKEYGFNKRLDAYELNWVNSKALELDLLNNISAVELYEVEIGCSEYETDAEQKSRVDKRKVEDIIRHNCVIKNTPNRSSEINYELYSSIEKFCKTISKDPSLFQYINYYYF